ncbi:unnamed protein product [Allacma fusca]|uniref:NADPH-dependent FMN reductase-like domain-containing protein n=1 Tax=Allacma fusca TaxID=39272 RepID=A0A8J2LSE6_9HEXA|nr:unnamed protein product [Allacma fusca]
MHFSCFSTRSRIPLLLIGTNLVNFTHPKSTERFPREGTGLEQARKYSCMSLGSRSTVPSPSAPTPVTVTLGGVTGRIICTEAMSTSVKKDKLKIVIFYGSSRPGRMVERVGTYVKNQVESQGMEAIILDPEALPMEILKVPLHFFPSPEKAPEWLRENDAKIRGADGFLILSAEYNCGIPPALSNLIDHFPPASYRHRPVGIVTYSMGSLGGVRAGIILRPKVSDIGMVAIPTAVMIPAVQNAFSADGQCLEERVAGNITKIVQELEWYSTAIKNQRAVKEPLPGPMH